MPAARSPLPLAVESAPVPTLSSPELHARFQAAQDALAAQAAAARALADVESRLSAAHRAQGRWQRLGALSGAASRRAQQWEARLYALEIERVAAQMAADEALSAVRIDVGDAQSPSFRRLRASFTSLCSSERIWDLVVRPSSTLHVTPPERTPVRFGLAPLPTVRPDLPALHFPNGNGPDLWIYPDMLVVGVRGAVPAFVDLRTVTVQALNGTLTELDVPPADATWKKFGTQRTGEGPRARTQPIYAVAYAELRFVSPRGLHEAFLISDAARTQAFAEAMRDHQHALSASQAG